MLKGESISENINNFLLLYFSSVFLVILITWKQTPVLPQSIYFWNILFSPSLFLSLLRNLKRSQYFFAAVAADDILGGIHQKMLTQVEM